MIQAAEKKLRTTMKSNEVARKEHFVRVVRVLFLDRLILPENTPSESPGVETGALDFQPMS